MKRSTAYLALVLILATFGVADYFLVTSSASVSRMARGGLEELFGDTLRFRNLTASWFDEVLVLEQAELFVTPDRIKILSADRAEVRFREGLGKRPHQILLDRPRLTLSKHLFKELEKMPKSGPIHEKIDPEDLPSLFCQGGTLEIIYTDIFRWDRPQAFSIRELSLVPSREYRYLVSGRLESPLLGGWEIQGFYDLKTEEFDLRMECNAFSFGDDLRGILDPRHHAAWDRYNPDGQAKAVVSLRQKGETPFAFSVSVVPQGMGLRYAKFPYPVSGMRGELLFRGDGFDIRHMVARNGPAIISFDGKAGGYDSEADFRFRLRIRDMDLDETLRDALPGKGRTIWDSFHASGTVDVDGWIERKRGPDLPVLTPLMLRFRDTTFQYAGFPYPAQNVNGTIRVELPRISILHLETSEPRWEISPLGWIPDRASQFHVHGWIDEIDTDPSLDLHLVGSAIPLDMRMREALGDTGKDLWKRLRPGGIVDIDWHVRKRGGEDVVHAGTVRLLGCRVKYDEIPLPLSEVTGEVRYRPERIELHSLRGKCGEAEVSLEGSLEEATARIGVRTVGLKLRPEVVGALPREVRRIIHSLKLEGSLNAEVDLRIHHGEERKMDGWIALKITDGTILGDVRVENILGDARLEVYVRGEETELRGPLRFTQATILGKDVQRLSCSLTKTGEVFRFLNIQGSFYDGVLTGWMKVDTESDLFSGDLRLAHMDLASYSRSTEAFGTSEPPEGKVDVEIHDLEGNAADSSTIRGSGKITISQGRLWRVPVFAGLFSLDPTKWGGKPVFDAGSIYFDIADRKVKIRTLGFEGKGTSIVGKGSVDFDGNLDLKLRMESGSLFGIDFFLFRIPVQVVDLLRNAILPIKVTGTLDDPKVNK